uniref:Uncharacterized protein n=1 Tax=Anguilla anguilla TaxID=7936 RepID=A0A0E9Y1F8_ANGAN
MQSIFKLSHYLFWTYCKFKKIKERIFKMVLIMWL